MELHQQDQHNQDSFFFNLPTWTHFSLATTPYEDEQRENLDEGLDLDEEESSEDENENGDIRVEWHITPFALNFPAANNVSTPAQEGGAPVKLRQGVWEKRIKQLRAFARAYGHCCVPTKNQQGLGGWAAYIQRLRRQNSLSLDKVRQLDELGFAWGSGETESSSPSSSRAPLDPPLVDPEPLSRQTTTTEATKRNGEEEEEPKEEQREEGEEEENVGARGRSARMDEKLFAGRVYQLRKFKRKHGHLRLGRTSDLAKWLARMKRYQHVGLLARDKEAVLRAAGVAFDGDRQPSPKQTRRRQYSDTTTGDQEWEVEAILDKRMVAAAVDRTPPAPLYEVKWKGYDETTWEPLANLVGCAELLKEFESARRKAEKQTARAAERSRGAVVSQPSSPAAQAAAAAVAQAPEAAEARRLAVYSNFPEADCTVALRLSGGCRDLALLWLYTEPREREWLESSVFRCRADQARRELGLPLDRPTTNKAKPQNQRAKRKRDNDVDENDDRVPDDDVDDDDGVLSPTMTTAAAAMKKVKSEAVEGDEDVDKARERERGGGKRAQAAEEEQARREERARRNLAEREERKALRDRKKAEDWERRRAQVRQAREEQRQQQHYQQQQQQQQQQNQQLQRQQQLQHIQLQQLQQQQQQQQKQQLQRQQQLQHIQQQLQRQKQTRLQQQQQQQQHLQHPHPHQDLLQHYRRQLQIDQHQPRAYGRPQPVGQQPAAAAVPLPLPLPPPPAGSLDAQLWAVAERRRRRMEFEVESAAMAQWTATDEGLSLGAAEPPTSYPQRNHLPYDNQHQPQPQARGQSWAGDRFKVVVANTLADPVLAGAETGRSQATTMAKAAAAPARASDHHRAQPTKLNEGAQHNSVATGQWTTSRGDAAAAKLKATESKAACQWTTTTTIRGDEEEEEEQEKEEEELKAIMGCSSNNTDGGVADDGEMWEEDPLLAGYWC